MKLLLSLMLFLFLCCQTGSSLFADDPDLKRQGEEVEELIRDHVRPAIDRLDDNDGAAQDKLIDKINAAAWNLMLGEFLAVETTSLSLWTTAVDAIEEGLVQLKELDTVEKAELTALAKDHKTDLMKFDILIKRQKRKEFQERLDLARDEEWKRINDLRKLARSYKRLVDLLAQHSFYEVTGNGEKAKTFLKQSQTQAENIKTIIDEARDFYLFEDEVRDEARGRENASYDVQLKLDSTPPFGESLTTNLMASQALTLWNLASGKSQFSLKPETKKQYRDLLERAAEVAKQALDTDADNPVALLAQARSKRDLALSIINDTPHEAHEQEHKMLRNSVVFLKKARNQMKADFNDSMIDRQLASEIDAITKPDKIVENAKDLTLAGHPVLAHKILENAKGAHRSEPELWMTLYHVGSDLGTNAKEYYQDFEQALATGILDQDDPKVCLLDSFLLGSRCWELICTRKLNEIDIDEKRSILKLIGTKVNLLDKLATNPKIDKLLQARMRSSSSYLNYLKDFLQSLEHDPNGPDLAGKNRIGRVFQDTLPILADAIESSPDSWDKFRLTQSLARLCFAYAYMATKHIPKYNPDAMIAYAAGYDLLARLPTNQTKYLRGIGTPLLNGIQVYKGRSDEDTENMMIEEKRRREQLGRFVEAMYVSHFGDKQAALNLLQKNGRPVNDNDAPIEAVDQLPLLSGFTDTVDHNTAIQAFTFLALVEAGKFQDAIEQILDAIPIEHQTPPTPAEIQEAVEILEEPIFAFALSQAIHAKLQSYRIFDDIDDRLTTIKIMKSLHQKLAILTDGSVFYTERYPHLKSQSQLQISRYDDNTQFINSLNEAFAEGNIRAVRHEAETGLRYHPVDKQLWNEFLDSSIELILRRQIEPNLPDFTIAVKIGAIPELQGTYYEAIVNESRGNREEAERLYQFTAKRSKDKIKDDKSMKTLYIQSKSKAIELRLN